MKTFLTIVALCVGASAFAQIEKGRSYGTGQLSFSNPDQTNHQYYNSNNFTNDNSSHSNGFGASLSYGHLISSSWAIGLRGDFNVSKTDYHATNNGNPSSNFSKGNGYGFYVYARKYFLIVEKLYVHLDGGVSYTNSRSHGNDGTSSVWNRDTQETSSVYISPGVTYFVTNRLALTANMGSLSYNKRDQTNNSNTFISTTHTKYVDFSPRLNSISLGASVYF